MLSLFRFLSDVYYSNRYNLLSGIIFPLGSLAKLILAHELSDATSGSLWERKIKNVPCQLWDGRPRNLKLQSALSLPLRCPWCHAKTRINWNFTNRANNKRSQECCEAWNHSWNDTDMIGWVNFVKDLKKSMKYPIDGKRWDMKGLALDLCTGEFRIRSARTIFRTIITPNSPFCDNAKDWDSGHTWTDFDSLVIRTVRWIGNRKRMRGADRMDEWEDKGPRVKARAIFRDVKSSYRGIRQRMLSIDLVSAVIRQRCFTSKITRMADQGELGPVEKATERYLNFMALMKLRVGK